MAYLPPRPAIASTTAYTAVSSATRRLKVFSPRSRSSCGSGSSTSATRGTALANLLAHGVPARFEGAHQPLGLLLEDLPALVEPLGAALAQQSAILLTRSGGQEQGGQPAERRPEQEPAEISAAAAIIRHGGCLLRCGACSRTRRRPVA